MVKRLTPKIRAHHLLCIEGFQGYGYDKKFTENLKDIIKTLKEDPNIQVTLVNEVDEICRMCPNKSKCEGDENLKAKDERLIKHLNLNVKETKQYHELHSLIENIDFKILEEICGNCQWIKKCKFYTKKRILYNRIHQ
ncbi:MAG: Uncharacterized protein XD44_0251 [Methanobacteriaceae archaeon 41_258]|nr:MAG: Uncharacterized protein XD44_0251 [Methanobacteriaceae archaeon 41_258]